MIEKLQILMNAATRVIPRTPHRQPITPVLRHIHWLPVYKRIDLNILCLTFKALNIGYLHKLLTDRIPSRSLQPHSCHRLHVSHRKLKYCERAFSFSASKPWNSIPDYIKSATSTTLFKKKLKTYHFEQYYDNLTLIKL